MPRKNKSVQQLFWEKVNCTNSPDECWEWQASTNKDGYGNFNFNGKPERAHRVAYYLTHGTIKEGMRVLHSCDNPRCCNPSHLREGTQAENVADCVRRGRARGSSMPGELNPMAKLDWAKVRSIRSEYQNRGQYPHGNNHSGSIPLSQKSIAKKYGVAQSLIGLITRNLIWKE